MIKKGKDGKLRYGRYVVLELCLFKGVNVYIYKTTGHLVVFN